MNVDQYLLFFCRLTERQDIRYIFEGLKSTQNTISREEFLRFLQDSQGVNLATEEQGYWNDVFDRFTSSQQEITSVSTQEVPYDQQMTFETFQRFLLDEKLNSATRHDRGHPVLDRPLNEYFISSSHNTYLMGRQVGGESSTEGYVEALKKNCRCIEIDCWDGDDGKPRVTHGRTLTTKASFLDCLKVINYYAFVGSDFPLIISLEVHCCDEQQRIMAQNMKDVFGDKVLLHPINDDEILPSPEQLKRRILIKVKEPKADVLPAPPLHRRQRSKSAPAFPTQAVQRKPSAASRACT